MPVRSQRVLEAAVGLAVVAGIVLRVVTYQSALGDTNSDEAIFGLMVRQAAHGHPDVFQWGLPYGGTQEILLSVPVTWLMGSGLLAIRVAPILIDAAAAVLVWRVGRRTIGEPQALVAAALFWVWPSRVLDITLHGPGFYASNVFYAALILLLVLRAEEQPSKLRAAVLGLALGLGFWQTSQIFPIALPAVAWLVWRAPRILRQAWVAVIAGVIGALPALVWNIEHHWASLHLNAGTSFTYAHRLRLLLSPVLPELLGLRIYFSATWIVPALLGVALYAALYALLAYGAYRAWNTRTLLLYLVAATFPFLGAISPKENLTTDPRYGVVIAPVLALLVAQLARSAISGAVILALGVIVTSIGLHGADRIVKQGTPKGDGFPPTPRSLAPLITTLERLHVKRAFANYWIAYRLDFDTHNRIVSVENGFDGLIEQDGELVPTFDPRVRYRPYDRAVRAGPHAYVFFKTYLPQASILNELTAHGYKRHLSQVFVIYTPPGAGAS
jgi:hypothetical protein